MSKRICIFGASITRGARDNKMGGWINRLDIFLRNNRNEYSAYNLGISGDTSRDLLKRFEVECQVRGPEVIVIAVGNNDSSTRSGEVYVSISEYKDNLNKLIEIGKKITDKIILVGLTQVIENEVTPVSWDENIFYYNKDLKEYNEVLKKVAQKNNLLFISMEGVVDDSNFSDGLHPDAVGHEKMFKQVKDFLIKNNVLE